MLAVILFLLLPSCTVSDQGLQAPEAHKYPPFNADEIRAITHGEPWPLPQKIQYLHGDRELAGPVRIVFEGINDSECDILQHLKRSHEQRLSLQWTRFVDAKTSDSDPFYLIVRVSKCPDKDEYPQQGMDEEYHLYVPASGNATIEAKEVWGALRGAETFTQLFYSANGTVHVRAATVHDWPEYPFRGTLIDSSRHFLPKYVVLRHIELLAQNKYNVLHWHLVDNEGFSYTSEKFPDLAKKGAYSPNHVYSRQDIQDVLRYARLHGIRVMAEFDTPGHVGSWRAQPGFLADCFDETGAQVTPSNILDPTEDRIYDFLKELIEEALETFPENYIHLGGDEVQFWTEQCWLNNSKIADFMKKHSFAGNTTALEDFYISRWQGIVKDLFAAKKTQGRAIFWQEVFDNTKPDKDVVIHIWKPPTQEKLGWELGNVTKAGHEALVSSCWYLDQISWTRDWIGYYNCDPRGFNGTDSQKKLVLGGEAALWGEYMDATNFEARAWPRASAAAERLWSSPKATQDYAKAWPRLHEHRCRLIARGYRAQPANGPDFCEIEYGTQ